MSNEGIRPEVVLANFVAMWLEEHGSAGSASAQCDELTPVIAEYLGPMLARARAEGFRAARERAALFLQGGHNPPCYERPAPSGTTTGECRNCSLAASIRAMEDAWEGGEPSECGQCGVLLPVGKRHECEPADCDVDGKGRAVLSGAEPPLSQFRAATERMEAATRWMYENHVRALEVPRTDVVMVGLDALLPSASPAAMLGEARRHMRSFANAVHESGISVPSDVRDALLRVRLWLENTKDAADAREGQG